MYPLQPDSQQQRSLLKFLRDKIGGKIGNGNIRPVTIRAFAELQNDDSAIEFDLRDTKSVLKGTEILIPDNRLVYGNLWGLGIAIVPIVGGVLKQGNMTMTSYPHPSLFGTTVQNGVSEINAARMLWNGTMRFETESTTRFDKVSCSDFQILDDQTAVPNLGIKHIDLQQAYTIFGNKSNLVQVKLAAGNYANIAGDATKKHFAVLEIKGFELLKAIDNQYVSELLG